MTIRGHADDVTLFAGFVALAALIVVIVWWVRRHRQETYRELVAGDPLALRAQYRLLGHENSRSRDP